MVVRRLLGVSEFALTPIGPTARIPPLRTPDAPTFDLEELMTSTWLVLLTLLPGFERPPESGGYSEFQGEWVATFYEESGVSLSSDITRTWLTTFSGTSMEAHAPDGSERKPGTFRLDPSGEPKQIDLIWKDTGPVLGIYEFEAGKLRICVGKRNEGRPTRFASNLASGTAVLVLERAEKVRGRGGEQAGSK